MPDSQTRGKRQQRQPALLHIAPNAPSKTCPSWWEGAVKKPIKVQPICQKTSTTSLQLNPRQNRERVTRKWFDQRRVSEREQMFPPSDPLVIRLNQDSVTTSLFYGSRCFQIIAWELAWDAKVLECRRGRGGDNKEFPLNPHHPHNPALTWLWHTATLTNTTKNTTHCSIAIRHVML